MGVLLEDIDLPNVAPVVPQADAVDPPDNDGADTEEESEPDEGKLETYEFGWMLTG